jgi:hypothetical protein
MKQNQNEKGIDKNMDNMRRNPHRNNAMNPRYAMLIMDKTLKNKTKQTFHKN